MKLSGNIYFKFRKYLIRIKDNYETIYLIEFSIQLIQIPSLQADSALIPLRNLYQLYEK